MGEVLRRSKKHQQLNFKESKMYPKISKTIYIKIKIKKFISIKEILKRENIILILSFINVCALIWLGYSANKIQEYQVKLLESEHLPVFDFKIEWRDGYEKLIIYNTGYRANEIKCRALIFLEEICYNNTTIKTVLVPLLDYYDWGIRFGENRTGLVTTFKNSRFANYLKFEEIRYKFEEYIKKKYNLYGYLRLVRYFNIKYYDDIVGKEHSDVYKVCGPFGEPSKLPNDAGKAIIDYYENNRDNGLYLRSATPELIYSKWANMNQVNILILKHL